jgi:ankyrin repeat protein
MLNCLELFKKDVELRFCCEQLITDLCTALSETSIKYNKEFRNYLEHIDDIFETGKRDIEQGNFFEMLDYIIDVKRRLILQFEIDSSPQLKQESGPSSVATTNSVAAENTPLFNKELEGTFSGMFSRENSSLKEQKKQQLKSRYNLPDLSEPQLARGLRNAAVNGKLDDLKDFIELGANIDANDNSQKKTALHYALEKEHMLCVHWLIEHGANYNIADALNTTAYAYARKHSLDIFRYNLQM